MKVTKAQLLAAIDKCHGSNPRIAKLLSMAQQSVWMRIQKDPELQEAQKQAKRRMVEVAEDGLMSLVRKRDRWAIGFILSTLGKNLGYTRTLNVEGRVESAGKVVIVLPDNGRDGKKLGSDARS